MNKVINGIDRVNKLMGEIAKYALVVIMLALVYEVIARYFFNNPTSWCTDVCEQGMIVLGALGGAYSYLYNSFVRVDVIYERLSLRRRALADICTFFVFAFFMVIMTWKCYESAALAWRLKMKTATLMAMPLYYGKTLVCIGAALLLLQGISILGKNIFVLIHNEEYPSIYKEEA